LHGLWWAGPGGVVLVVNWVVVVGVGVAVAMAVGVVVAVAVAVLVGLAGVARAVAWMVARVVTMMGGSGSGGGVGSVGGWW
jgi:hypothetical protein